MKFNFKLQQYQTDAVEAVVNIFKGQGLHERVGYIRDMGTLEDTDKQLSFLAEDIDADDELLDLENSMGYKNEAVQLTDTELLKNIHEMQTANNIRLSPNLIKELGRCSLDIEMETGTGKTYVYIKTMFELNKRYGWSKFIVVVPSISCYEGHNEKVDRSTSGLEQHLCSAGYLLWRQNTRLIFLS